MENKSIKIIQRREYKEFHVQLIPLPGETSNDFSRKIEEILCNDKAKIIRATFFGRLNEKDNTIKQIESKLSGIDFPFSWIEGDNCTDSFINGVYFFAVSGIDVKRLYRNNTIAGSCFQTKKAGYYFLGGLHSEADLSPVQQTENILNSAEDILKKEGFSFENTIRTWYYLDDILDWYNDFNRARTSFFLNHTILKKRIPASTGIGGKNSSGSKICLELMAVEPRSNDFSIEVVNSPLQCSANKYGSSFSRAIQYSDGEYSNLTVSGTASISPEGETANINDINKQIDLTFNVVKAILESQGYSFNDVIRAYAYCRDKSYNKAFYDYVATCGYDKLVFICTENKICRDDLLFEIELDVIKNEI